MALTSIMCCTPLLNIEPKFLVLISKLILLGFFFYEFRLRKYIAIMDFESYSISKLFPLLFLDMLID